MWMYSYIVKFEILHYIVFLRKCSRGLVAAPNKSY